MLFLFEKSRSPLFATLEKLFGTRVFGFYQVNIVGGGSRFFRVAFLWMSISAYADFPSKNQEGVNAR